MNSSGGSCMAMQLKQRSLSRCAAAAFATDCQLSLSHPSSSLRSNGMRCSTSANGATSVLFCEALL